MLEQIKVEMYCPITGKNTYVFLPVIIHEGKKYIDRNRFDGCDGQFHRCPECQKCQEESYRKLMSE